MYSDPTLRQLNYDLKNPAISSFARRSIHKKMEKRRKLLAASQTQITFLTRDADMAARPQNNGNPDQTNLDQKKPKPRLFRLPRAITMARC